MDRDPDLSLLKKFNFVGWPEHKKQVHVKVQKNLVFKECAIVPVVSWQEMLKLVHQCHSGIERSHKGKQCYVMARVG
ncbi:hypothetical protein PR048_025666, partial [Dryococelus australis]